MKPDVHLLLAALIVACGLLGGSGVAAQGDPASSPPVPEVLESKLGPEGPVWLSADALTGSDGSLRLDALPENSVARIERAMEKAIRTGRDCILFGPIITDQRPGVVIPKDLEGMASNALAIFRPTIRETMDRAQSEVKQMRYLEVLRRPFVLPLLVVAALVPPEKALACHDGADRRVDRARQTRVSLEHDGLCLPKPEDGPIPSRPA